MIDKILYAVLCLSIGHEIYYYSLLNSINFIINVIILVLFNTQKLYNLMFTNDKIYRLILYNICAIY